MVALGQPALHPLQAWLAFAGNHLQHQRALWTLLLQRVQQPALGGVVTGQVVAFAQQQSRDVRCALHECRFVQVLATGQVNHRAWHWLRAGHCGQRKQAQWQPATARTPH